MDAQPLVLVAGATGYVGSRLVTELLDRRRYRVRALVRQTGKLPPAARDGGCEEAIGDVLLPETLAAACRGCTAVILCVGSSLMGPGSVQDAFRPIGEGNLALFEAARAAGASRFVMIASLNSEACRDEFEGFRVREEAIDRIKHLADLDARTSEGDTAYTVFAPSGFFKDYDRIFRTVQRRRRASSLGDGFSRKSNPIHGADLAARSEILQVPAVHLCFERLADVVNDAASPLGDGLCSMSNPTHGAGLAARMADSLERPEEANTRLAVGGPDVLTFRQIALLAAGAAGVRNIRYKAVPVWGVRLMMGFLRLLSWMWAGAARYHAFAQFLLIIATRDSVGECCGSRRLVDHFRDLASARAGR